MSQTQFPYKLRDAATPFWFNKASTPSLDALTFATPNAGGNATERSEGRVDHNVGRLTPGEE